MFGIDTPVFVAFGSMALLGVLFGVGLVVASRVFAVKHDPLVDAVLDALPGINCGACGYRGCGPYAEAVVAGEAVNRCVPGGDDTAVALARIMGVEVGQTTKLRAVCHCQGSRDRCGTRFAYAGEADCRAAHITSGGPKDCEYGCLGFGTCAEVCPVDAITMSEGGLPVVDADACIACGQCVKACPRGLFSLESADHHIHLGCSARETGRAVKDMCSVGCIACGLCVRKDPNEAIVMDNNLPVLDYQKAAGDFSVAADVCPMGCFVVEEGAPVAAAGGQGDE